MKEQTNGTGSIVTIIYALAVLANICFIILGFSYDWRTGLGTMGIVLICDILFVAIVEGIRRDQKR